MRGLVAMAVCAFVLAASGCVADSAPKEAPPAVTPSAAPEWLNMTGHASVRAQATPCVTGCVVWGYSHKFADAPNRTVTRLAVEITWDKPAVLCDKLEVELRLVGKDSSAFLYRQSGSSPITFDLTNLSVPNVPGTFLRLMVGPEWFEPAGAGVYANLEIPYKVETHALLRPTMGTDVLPTEPTRDPAMKGPASHC